MGKRSFSGRLPDGIVTSNVNAYVEAWRAFAAPLCRVLNGDVLGYEPGVTFTFRDGRKPLALDCETIRLLNAAIGDA